MLFGKQLTAFLAHSSYHQASSCPFFALIRLREKILDLMFWILLQKTFPSRCRVIKK